MATGNQIGFLKLNKDSISEPILIIGSRQYDFDSDNIRTNLQKMGFKDITGIDISEGDGVDFVADITDAASSFVTDHKEYYRTIICMEVLTHVKNPFRASEVLVSMLQKNGTMILSECFVRKISKMPLDLWRFTYDGTKLLFSELTFDDSKAMLSLTREKKEGLIRFQYPLPQILQTRHPDENSIGFFMRRIHRKFLSGGVFKMSRLFPETTIYSIARK